MSVYCRVAHPHLLLKAVAVLNVAKDSWATVAFTDTAVVLHVEGVDRSITATATLPKALFTEYSASNARFMVHLTSLRDALLLGGPAPLAAVRLARIVLAYPMGDAKLLVELTDGDCVLQSTLVTRPVLGRLLDLRFGDARVVSQVTLLGSAARDAIEDLVVAQCPHAAVVLDPEEGVTFHGDGGPYGTVTVQMRRDTDVILSARGGGKHAQTRVLRSHLALACGVRCGGKTWRAAGAVYDATLGLAGPCSGGSGVQAASGGFERLLLQINEERQLGVVHMPRDHDVAVAVTVVISPQSGPYEE
ncbi:cell cycle checkpoint protein [Trypanosoma grayi]|uniref:cell cycle checkpoint protein n=1 Tax=Trypanosoma grayi TaxID=71804 RepID=UPI0004F48F3F|nr:cell cycle checkpoint protein [Trypanosoma grayi]KEG08132.1 cell cycle checkpoint protein [Trypanosoma grayi]